MISATTSCAAHGRDSDEIYLPIEISDNKQMVIYDLDIQTLHAKQIATCAIPLTDERCRLPEVWEAGSERYNRKTQDAELVRAQLKSIPYFYPLDATLDTTHTLVLIANLTDDHTKHLFKVFQLPAARELLSRASERRALDAEWVGNHGCFALLTSTTSSAMALLPWNWLQTFSGHAPQHDTYYLELYSPDGSLLAETLIHEKIRDAYVSLVSRRSPVPGRNSTRLREPC